ncbi:MAG: hypothetical protein KGD64_14930 [Candidatus Heimdallarchaeota archaeon]|nr:hypothetical protein [Candidatus Heimdallarchaeota archaeon]
MEEEEVSNLLAQFPLNYSEYYNYDELISRMNDFWSSDKKLLGKSTNNIDIFGYQIGEGSIRILIYGLPHADEPIGTLTVDLLGKLISSNKDMQKNFTFLLIPCIDPDGLSLNEGWLKGAFNPKKFFLNRYHRPDEEDIDWSFPVKSKNYNYTTKIEETKILIKLIHSFDPHLFTTLHSIQFSGIHFYFSNNYVTIFDKIENFVENSSIPLQRGTPFFIEEDWAYRPGFYRFYTTKEMVTDYIRDNIDISTLRRGEFSAGYFLQNNPKGMAIVPEMPLYYDLELNNLEKGDKTKEETILESNRIMLRMIDYIEPMWKNYKQDFNRTSPHYLRIYEIVENWRKEIKEEMKITKREGSKEIATKSEIYSNEVVVEYNNCNTLGTLHQLVGDSPRIEEGLKKRTQKQLVDKIESISLDIESRSKIQYSDINEMMKIQTFSILTSLDFLLKKRKGKNLTE